MTIEAGTWVKVWGQVVDPRPHPEDVAVEFFSHNEQYTAYVKATRVEEAEGAPDDVESCYAMKRMSVPESSSLNDATVMVMCQRYYNHPGKHKSGGVRWTDSLTDGYLDA